MVLKRKLSPAPLFDSKFIETALETHGVKQIHARTLWKLALPLARNPKADPKFEDIPNRTEDPEHGIPNALKRYLLSAGDDKDVAFLTSEVMEVQKHATTTKLLIKLQDGKLVESVIIYNKGYNTLCVSSQVGCRMACTFCATGTLGLSGNLWAGEIVEQLIHALRVDDIRNIVFMGMGEPLDNYDAVCRSVKMMTDTHLFNLAPRHITISTVGVVPRMRQLTNDLPGINFALSLHAPTQELRLKIVPTAKAYSIEKIMDALDYHLARSKKTRVLIESIVIKGINDSVEVAHEFGKLLAATDMRREKLILNLIPYNPTLVEADYEAPSDEVVHQMQDLMIEEYGMHVRIRKEMGQDNQAACGQLALRKGPCERGTKVIDNEDEIKSLMPDIEDMMGSSSSTSSKSNTPRSTSTLTKRKSSKRSSNRGALTKRKPPPPVLRKAEGTGAGAVPEEAPSRSSWWSENAPYVIFGAVTFIGVMAIEFHTMWVTGETPFDDYFKAIAEES